MAQINSEPGYISGYKSARHVSQLTSFLGWLVFLTGVMVSIVGVYYLNQDNPTGYIVQLAAALGLKDAAQIRVIDFLLTLAGIGLTFAGLFMVAAGQITRAIVDNADHTREILRLMTDKV